MLWSAFEGLFVTPPDFQQGEGYRIIYVHVPTATLSMVAYCVMAIAAAVGLIWRMKLAHALAAACAFPGAVFTALALVTGSIWGRPMWGTYWAWDPRLTSELLLLFLYLGYFALRASFDDVGRADRASAVLAIIGIVDIPVIEYSVVWWNSLHQGPSISLFRGTTIDQSMLAPLLVMMLAYLLFFAAVVCDGLAAEIVQRERNASWLSEAVR